MSRQEKLRRIIRRQYVRSVIQKALCIEKDMIKLFYTKLGKFGIIITTNSMNKFNQ
jgi:hypothetical protein